MIDPEKFIRDNLGKMTLKEISHNIGTNCYFTSKIAKKIGLGSKRKVRRFTEDEDFYIKTNWYSKKITEIASYLKRHPITIEKRAKRIGLPTKENLKKEEKLKRREYILQKYGNTFFDQYPKTEIKHLCKKLAINRRVAETELVESGLYKPIRTKKCKEIDSYILSNWEKINIQTMAKNLSTTRETIWKHVKKLSLPPKNRKGINSGKWKGGCCNTNKQKMSAIRKSVIGYAWERDVKLRDNLTCKKCGSVGHRNQYYRIVGVSAHHVYNFYDYPNKRFDLNNGITLCVKCHEEFHDKYGYRHTNKNQLTRFIKNG